MRSMVKTVWAAVQGDPVFMRQPMRRIDGCWQACWPITFADGDCWR